MPPLQDITTNVLSFRENLQTQEEIEENNNLRYQEELLDHLVSTHPRPRLAAKETNQSTDTKRECCNDKVLCLCQESLLISNRQRRRKSTSRRFQSYKLKCNDIFDSITSEFDLLNLSSGTCIDLSASNDDEIFTESLARDISLQHANSNLKNKRLSLPSSHDQAKIFKQMNNNSREELLNLVLRSSTKSKSAKLDQHKHKQIVKKGFQPCLKLHQITRLKTFFNNINKALPERVYGSRKDAVTFKRVEVHILLFKEECLSQCRNMCSERKWYNLTEYIFEAVKIVSQLPQWDNTAHNLHKKQLIKLLASYCEKSLSTGEFRQEAIVDLKKRLSKYQKLAPFYGRVSKTLEKM